MRPLALAEIKGIDILDFSIIGLCLSKLKLKLSLSHELFAFNKTESMNDTEILKKVQELDLIENKNWISISAHTGKNIEKLKTLIIQSLDSTTKINTRY